MIERTKRNHMPLPAPTAQDRLAQWHKRMGEYKAQQVHVEHSRMQAEGCRDPA